MNRLVIYKSRFARRSQRWRWRLVAENGRKIANGGEGYANRAECEAMGVGVVSGRYKAAAVPAEHKMPKSPPLP